LHRRVRIFITVGGWWVGGIHSKAVRPQYSLKISVNHSRRVGATGVKTAVVACARRCFQQGGSSECQSCSKLSECGGMFQSAERMHSARFTRCDRSLQTGKRPGHSIQLPTAGKRSRTAPESERRGHPEA
jgi:hypothetical protein